MATVVTINKTDTKEQIEEKLKILNATSSKKGFPAKEFTGKVRSYGDPMEYQKKMRDEWE